MSNQHEGQWDDNTIITRYRVAFDRNPSVHHMALMCWIRDELQQQIDALRQELAGREWEPLEEGIYPVGHQYGNYKTDRLELHRDTNGLQLFIREVWGSDEDEDYNKVSVFLPDEYRVCRRLTPASQEARNE